MGGGGGGGSLWVLVGRPDEAAPPEPGRTLGGDPHVYDRLRILRLLLSRKQSGLQWVLRVSLLCEPSPQRRSGWAGAGRPARAPTSWLKPGRALGPQAEYGPFRLSCWTSSSAWSELSFRSTTSSLSWTYKMGFCSGWGLPGAWGPAEPAHTWGPSVGSQLPQGSASCTLGSHCLGLFPTCPLPRARGPLPGSSFPQAFSTPSHSSQSVPFPGHPLPSVPPPGHPFLPRSPSPPGPSCQVPLPSPLSFCLPLHG